MEIDARNFVRLGWLMNLLLMIAVAVLVSKAFSNSGRQPVHTAAASAPAAAAVADSSTNTTDAASHEPAAVEPTATAEPQPTATTAPAETANEAAATTADNAAAADAAGAPAEPSQIVLDAVNKGTCNACHTIPNIPGAVGVVGPNLANIGNDAANRIPGYSAEQYLHESIVDPNAFVAPQCPFGACMPGSMPATLVQTLSEEEINAVVAFLLTMKGE